MTDDTRALCDELAEALCGYALTGDDVALVFRARALLDQPVAEEPTDEELLRLAREWNSGFESIELHFAADYARAVLARWGRPTPQPVAVSERLPGPDDCLDEGWAWFFNQRIGWRQAVLPVSTGYTHWLPANALPIPEATND
jgi:hypothetical protein